MKNQPRLMWELRIPHITLASMCHILVLFDEKQIPLLICQMSYIIDILDFLQQGVINCKVTSLKIPVLRWIVMGRI